MINVYRVCWKEWMNLKKTKNLFGNKLTNQSGFIHLSTKNKLKKQLINIINQEKVVILEFAKV